MSCITPRSSGHQQSLKKTCRVRKRSRAADACRASLRIRAGLRFLFSLGDDLGFDRQPPIASDVQFSDDRDIPGCLSDGSAQRYREVMT